MQDTELCYMTATEALRGFMERTLSPLELVEAVIQRSEAVNPKVNAYTYTFFERALDQARKAEQRYTARKVRRRLEGVPVVIKDDHDVKGEITTHGSRLHRNNVSEKSCLTVERILRAGAIMIARSTTPEFAAATICHSPLWGVTRNPWNLAYSPGGSSGGAGAALAAGMTTLADGADYAGSVRIPASCNGVFGYKPPSGRNPSAPPWNLNRFSVYGPLARSVSDGALMQNVMSGRHAEDITSLPTRVTLPIEARPIAGWKIALSTDLGFFEVAPEVKSALYDAAQAFRELGCEVDEIELDWTDKSLDAFCAYAGAFSGDENEGRSAEELELLADYSRTSSPRILEASSMSAAEGVRVRAEMYASLGPLLETHQILICPTVAVPGVAADLSPLDASFEINGIPLDATLGWCMTYPFNMLSQLPAASVPNGFSPDGVPIGLQIVGRPFRDASVFRAAAAFEQARPWRHKRPGI